MSDRVKSDPIESWLKRTEAGKAFLRDVLEYSRANDLTLEESLRRNLHRFKGRAAYVEIKKQFPELFVKEDVEDLLDLTHLKRGRAYYDKDNKLVAEGWVAEALAMGPEGIPVLSDEIRATDPQYVAQLVTHAVFPRMSLGMVRTSSEGIENLNNVLDPTSAALLAISLKGNAVSFANKELKKTLEQRLLIGFAHAVQTAHTEKEARSQLASARSKFKLDRDKVVQRSHDRIEGLVGEWGALPSKDNSYPSLHQYLRASLTPDLRRVLYQDCTGSGKTGSIMLTHYTLSDRLRQEEGRGARTLVIAPAIPSVTAWAEGELNEKYAAWLGRKKEEVVFLGKPSDISKLSRVKNGGVVVIGDGKLSVRPEAESNGKPAKKRPSKGESEDRLRVNRYVHALTAQEDFFDLIAVDECQLIKNNSKRTSAALEVIANNPSAVKIVASATPAERDLNDLRTMLHVLEPERYKPDEVSAFDLGRDLSAVREIVRSRAFFFTKDDLRAQRTGAGKSKEAPLPKKVTYETYAVQMPQRLAKEYGDKWMQLYQPIEGVKFGLAGIKELLDTLFESKLEGVRDLIRERAKTDQVIVYTRYRKNARRVAKMLTELGISNVHLNGTISAEVRKDLLERFRDGDDRAVSTTQQCMEVGVDMTSRKGNPISIIHLDPPRSTGQYAQLNGRADRIGQSGEVSVFSVVSESSHLEGYIRSYAEELHDQWDLVLPEEGSDAARNAFMPIDAAAFERIKLWTGLFEQVLSRSTTADIEELVSTATTENDRGLNLDNDLMRLLIFDSPHRLATNFFKSYNGVDYRQMENAQARGNAWKRIVQCYNHNWQFSASAYTANTLRDICAWIDEARPLEKRFSMRADLGCGAAYMARTFDKAFDSLDIDPLMLELGKQSIDARCAERPELKGELEKTRYMRASIQETGLQSGVYDLVIASYVWQYQAQRTLPNGEVLRQLEDALIEANRIMKVGGYLFAPVQRSINQRSFDRLCRNAGLYGFESQAMGIALAPTERKELQGGCLVDTELNGGGSERGFRLFAFKKIADTDNCYKGCPDDFALFTDSQVKAALGRQRGITRSVPRTLLEPKQVYGGYQAEDGTSLRDLVQRSLE